MKTYRVPHVLESIFLADHATDERNIMRQSEHPQFSFRRIWDINVEDSDLTEEMKRHVTLAVPIIPKTGPFSGKWSVEQEELQVCLCSSFPVVLMMMHIKFTKWCLLGSWGVVNNEGHFLPQDVRVSATIYIEVLDTVVKTWRKWVTIKWVAVRIPTKFCCLSRSSWD